MGCHRFWNYKQVIQTGLDGQWIDGGKFLMSIGTYTTYPIVARGGTIDWECLFYPDYVHVDIAFCNWVLVRGFWYVLMYVDCAICYKWVFGLKDLSSNSILVTFCLFWANAGSYACYFWFDCDANVWSN